MDRVFVCIVADLAWSSAKAEDVEKAVGKATTARRLKMSYARRPI